MTWCLLECGLRVACNLCVMCLPLRNDLDTLVCRSVQSVTLFILHLLLNFYTRPTFICFRLFRNPRFAHELFYYWQICWQKIFVIESHLWRHNWSFWLIRLVPTDWFICSPIGMRFVSKLLRLLSTFYIARWSTFRVHFEITDSKLTYFLRPKLLPGWFYPICCGRFSNFPS